MCLNKNSFGESAKVARRASFSKNNSVSVSDAAKFSTLAKRKPIWPVQSQQTTERTTSRQSRPPISSGRRRRNNSLNLISE